MNRKRVSLIVVVGLEVLLALILLWTVAADRAPVTAAPQAEVHVCPAGPPTCDYASIQAAMDAAAESDVVKVAEGVYDDAQGRPMPAGYPGSPPSGIITQVLYITKTVTVRGGYTTTNGFADPPDPVSYPTVLDALGQGRVMFIAGDISPTVEGLRLTGGDATDYEVPMDGGEGGGLMVISATATISHCVVDNNLAAQGGFGSGGGVYLLNSPAALFNNTIVSNTAATGWINASGGGISLVGSDAILEGNLIAHNTANPGEQATGGGLYSYNSNPRLYGNIVRDNAASGTWWGHGGGLRIYNGTAWLVNNVVVDNFSGAVPDTSGAGLLIGPSATVFLQHTTIQGNQGVDGAGIEVSTMSSVILTNTIVANQSVGITVTAGSTATLNGVLWSGNGTDTGGPGVVQTSDEISGLLGLASDGYHLLSGSAAIDAGLDDGVATDVDGQLRPYSAGYDLGADEWVPAGVTETVDPMNGGTLVYTDSRGLTTTVEVPAGAITQPILLAFEVMPTVTHPALPGQGYVGPGFDLSALRYELRYVYLPLVVRSYSPGAVAKAGTAPALTGPSLQHLPTGQDGPILVSIEFLEPVTVTIHYSSDDLVGIADESSLRIYYWDDPQWLEAADTCVPPSTYVRDLAGNSLAVPICHLTEFSIQGE